jgi:hypothetical protein
MEQQSLTERGRPGRPNSRQQDGQPKRVPVGAGNKLEFTGRDPNYAYRVVMDRQGRLDAFRAAGYDFCYSEVREADKGVAEGTATDTRKMVNLGCSDKGYLMRIPKEYYDQDQADKLNKVKATEAAMKNRDPNPRQGSYQGLSDE